MVLLFIWYGYSIVKDFSDTACAIVKHANPCGFGLGDNPKRAFMNRYNGYLNSDCFPKSSKIIQSGI